MPRESFALPVLVSALLLAACERNPPAAPAQAAAADGGGAQYSTALDVKQVMNWVMDPNADVVFAAVATIVTEHGEEKIEPKTDAQWNAVRNSAAVVLESGNLLMLPGRAKADGEWNEKAKALIAAAQTALQAIDVKDPDALFTAAGEVYEACSACHARYMFADAAQTAAN